MCTLAAITQILNANLTAGRAPYDIAPAISAMFY